MLMETAKSESPRHHPNWFEGPRLLAVAAVALFVATGASVALGDMLTERLRLAIRLTARTSLLLFLLAFTAAAVAKRWPNDWTTWQLRNRRYLGLSFATSHLLHALVLVALLNWRPEIFWQLTQVFNVVSGSIAYAFIVMMATTSTNWTARRIGPLWWRRLHVTGSWYVWIVFMVAFGKRIPAHPEYTVAIVMLIAAAALRLTAHRRHPA
jgi:methionine sulfoxide reductase heme-binding subunit